jgi:hypothetical protein
MAAIEATPQLRLVEEALDDDDLAAQLEEWQAAKEALVGPRQRYTRVDAQIKAALDDLGAGEYRCGRFRIRVSHGEARRVEFERASSKRIAIKLFDDDDEG